MNMVYNDREWATAFVASLINPETLYAKDAITSLVEKLETVRNETREETFRYVNMMRGGGE